VTWRAIVVAALIAPLNTLWLYLMQEVWQVGNPTAGSLYFNVFFIILVVTLVNAGVRRLRPGRALSQGELLVIYVLLCITSSCAGYDSIHWVLPDTTGVIYRASPELGWERTFFRHLPVSLIMRDEHSLRWLFEGGRSFYAEPDLWRPWTGPALWWMALMSALWLAPLGLAVFVRRRWQEDERLLYPIAQVPLELTHPQPATTRSATWWIAVGVVLAIRVVSALHEVHPAFPRIPLSVAWERDGSPSFLLSRFLDASPWKAASNISVSFLPTIIGFGMLLPAELLTSCVFFFFFHQGQQVLARALGAEVHPGSPFIKEQSFGGYLAIVVFALWIGRGYWRRVLGCVRRPDPAAEAREPIGYRTAAIVFLTGLMAVVWISWSAGPQGMEPGAGMSLPYALAHWGLYYVLTFVAGRLRAEVGAPNHELERLGPVVFLGNTFGTRRGRRPSDGVVRSLTVGSVFFSLTRGMRSIPFPHTVEGLKLMSSTGGSSRSLFTAMLGATVAGVILAWLIYLPTVYHYGAGTAKMVQYSDWHTYETYGQLSSWVNNPQGLDLYRLVPTIVGFAVYGGMMLLRTGTSWWPLHPLGYALSSTYGMLYWWCPFLIALLVKGSVLRYGGVKANRWLRCLAFGLIVGDTLGTCLASFIYFLSR